MIRCYTLCDITQTGFTRKPTTPDELMLRNQQRNYETFMQLISLRAQPELVHAPLLLTNVNIEDYKFGDYFMASIFHYTLWFFDFESEHNDSYGDSFENLKNDFNNIPIIVKLTENAKIINIIKTLGPDTNTYFERI